MGVKFQKISYSLLWMGYVSVNLVTHDKWPWRTLMATEIMAYVAQPTLGWTEPWHVYPYDAIRWSVYELTNICPFSHTP